MLSTSRSSRALVRAALSVFFAFGCTAATEREAPHESASALGLDPTPAFTVKAEAGLVDGARIWLVPDTPNGLHPNQSWFAVAGAPDGSIYMSGQDHVTNSALYRLKPEGDELRYVGDARAASEAANNWLPWETAEKFHVRPTSYRGRVYVATADYSNQDDGYLQRRGFHWYAYDVRKKDFLDLSASEPNGVGAEHISIFATALDARRGLLYGLGSPTSHLYQLDIARGTTRDLGRSPELVRTFYNPGRFIWVDDTGRVYLTVGTAGTLAPGEPATPLYVLYWDPVEGWGTRKDWPIAQMLRTGQWSRDGKRCYILDYPLNLYVFDDERKTFTKITQGVLDAEHVSPRTAAVRVRSMNLSPNERKIYFVNDSAPANSLFEWEFRATSSPRELLRVEAIDPRLDARYSAYTGHDSWDHAGRFYFTGFGGEGTGPSPDLYFVGLDPVRVKAALGLLPGVPALRLVEAGRTAHLVRAGDRSTELEVLLERSIPGGERAFSTVTVPAGARRVRVPLRGEGWRIVPDGDTYVTAR